MPRVAIDLEEDKAQIIQWHQEGLPHNTILERLQGRQSVSRAVYMRRLRKWGLQRQKYMRDNHGLLLELQPIIERLTYHPGLSDEQISQSLSKVHDVEVSVYTVRRIRLDLGIKKRVTSSEKRELSDQKIKEMMQKAISAGKLRTFGRRRLHNWFREEGYIASR